MKECPECNTEYTDDKKYCKNCGAQLLFAKDSDPKISTTKSAADTGYKIDSNTQNEIENKTYYTSEINEGKTWSSKIFLNAGSVLFVVAVLFVIVGIVVFLFSTSSKTILPSLQDSNVLKYSVKVDETKPMKVEAFSNSDYGINYEALVTDTTNWSLSKKYIFDQNGNPRNSFISDFIAKLESPNGDGVPVTRSEFEELLEKPEARIIYINRLIRYATPVSVQIQKKEHEDYTKIFLREKRVLQGIKFLHNYEMVLSHAETRFNVQRKDLVSILMWESGLGEFTGDYQIFNIFLEQLAMMDYAQEYAVRQIISSGQENPLEDYSKKQKETKRLDNRRKDAANNLAILLRLCKQNKQDPFLQKGSWGGAIGFVQFMPYSLVYAVDGNNDGIIDLFNFNDAIFSAANYLIEKGKYGSSEESRRQAILTYNRSQEYASGVIAYAEAIWRRYSAGE